MVTIPTEFIDINKHLRLDSLKKRAQRNLSDNKFRICKSYIGTAGNALQEYVGRYLTFCTKQTHIYNM